jgi:ATP diphosphatase
VKKTPSPRKVRTTRRSPAASRGRKTVTTASMQRRAATRMARLVGIMAALRSKRGCPWDLQQTHETLRPFLLEETYELLDTIDRGALDELPGELGDVLFQCVFHAQIGAEDGRFDIGGAIDRIIAKLIRRHPHVFTSAGRLLPPARRKTATARTPGVVLEQWEALKAKEQTDAGAKKRVLAGVPRAMPALVRAHEIGTRVAAVGFDWSGAGAVVDKIDEEVRELRDALDESPARAAEEFGDLLFAVANLGRKLGLEPESALRAANDKFTGRFEQIESELERRGSDVHRATLEEMEAIWQEIKKPGFNSEAKSAKSPA